MKSGARRTSRTQWKRQQQRQPYLLKVTKAVYCNVPTFATQYTIEYRAHWNSEMKIWVWVNAALKQQQQQHHHHNRRHPTAAKWSMKFKYSFFSHCSFVVSLWCVRVLLIATMMCMNRKKWLLTLSHPLALCVWRWSANSVVDNGRKKPAEYFVCNGTNKNAGMQKQTYIASTNWTWRIHNDRIRILRPVFLCHFTALHRARERGAD